ncbi:sugar ABC transporter permease [Clostridium sp.]|uniref:sugar ABC transporter permease n=1 Tax=Clostridium sp. TaxID=1506 RepID=UPI003D6CEDB9
MEFFKEGKQLIKQNIREYGMYIALVVIMIIFTITTNGLFISSRNISNLINQTGYIAVLAVGMTLIIVIKHIDLSVGFASGFMGAIAAILLTRFNAPFIVTIIIVLAVGILIGLFNGFLVATMGIPSFVATLAGMLIFRGGLLLLTESSGTIVISNKTFNAIGNGFIPDIAHVQGIHLLTILIGILAIILYAWSIFNTRKNKIKYNFDVVSMKVFVFQLIFVSVIIGYITWILAGYNGLSWTVVIVIAVVAIYHYITTQTVLGRHIYAVGGNIEAAKLSGINVKKITYIVFASMGMLIGLCGILFASRLQSASTTAGTLFELDAIAAAYVGGVSADGGVGKVTGSIIGALVMSSLISGMNLMGTGISYQYIVRGAVLVIAVIFDVKTRNKNS